MVNVELVLARYCASNSGTAITAYNPQIERIMVPIVDSRLDTLLANGYHLMSINLDTQKYTNVN